MPNVASVAPTIGITGTKGKTTTSALTHALLAADPSHRAFLGGNIGRPIVERLRWRIAAGTIKYMPSDDTGIFAQGESISPPPSANATPRSSASSSTRNPRRFANCGGVHICRSERADSARIVSMQDLANVGLLLAIVGLALAVGIPISVKVYGPPSGSVRWFRAVAKAGLWVGVVGVVFMVVGAATGNAPG